jgi:hypothetical protein
MEWKEDNIEDFIRENRKKFDTYNPSTYHENHFSIKLYNKFKKIVSIVSYLIKVLIVIIVVFILSIWAWNSWIRKDRHEVTLKQKIENIVTFKK